MKQITGLSKYSYLLKGTFKLKALRLTFGFVFGMFKMMGSEKLTLLNGKIYVNTHFTPMPTRSFETALDTMLEISKGGARPISVYLSLTDKCSFNCAYCSNHKAKKSKGLNTKQLLDAVKQVQDAGTCCIGFTGGEPTLRKDLEKIISAVDERSYTVLFTSGLGIDEKRALKLKTAGLDIAGVSLDSHIEKEQNTVRGLKSAFKTSVNAVKCFVKVGVYTSVSCVLTEEMAMTKKKYEFVKFCAGLGVHEVRFLEPIPSGKLWGKKPWFVKAEKDEMERFRREINKDASLPKVAMLSRMESPETFGCGAGWFHMYIDSAGNVCPCDFVQKPYGNIKKEKFAAIYNKMRKGVEPFNSVCLNKRLNGRGELNEKSPILLSKLIGRARI